MLNLAWSSIIRLLLVLANLPEQPRLAQSMAHHSTGVPSFLVAVDDVVLLLLLQLHVQLKKKAFLHMIFAKVNVHP